MTKQFCRLMPAMLAMAWCIAAQAGADWIEKSNAYTAPVLDLDAKYQPEAGSYWGADKFDGDVLDLRPEIYERSQAEAQKMLDDLKAKAAAETDTKVRQDIEILITSVANRIESARLNRDLMLPFVNVGETMFQGLQVLLDPRNKPERQKAAVTRLRRYAGMERGYEPLTELARARSEERFGVEGLTGPYGREVEKAIANTDSFVEGLAQMFKDAKLRGWEKAHRALAKQLKEYNDWLEKDMMPRARTDNRLPPAIYADNLKGFGVYMEPQVLIDRATFGYTELRSQMQILAREIARDQNLPDSDYRAVLKSLKARQIQGDAILPLYKERLKMLEGMIAEHDLVTLPARESEIRLASDAESAASPAPHLNPPRLIGNTGEFGEFVLPLRNPNAEPGEVMDDFTNEGYSWTLTAHESRPGHELQFSAMVETGVSLARAIYAFNSANAEGWGLYAEAIMIPYLPPDGRFFALQSRMLRAARMFLDPMLNLGLMKPEQAKKLLMEEVGFSAPFATQEVDRYTYRAPGQATSYYYGYMLLQSMRLETEIALGEKFDQKAFHDFILAQGLLPPDQLRKAIMEEFVADRI